MRKALLLLVLVADIAQGQSWCPPGAEWIFNFSSQQANGVRRAWYSGDTLVGGLPCQRIDQTIIAYEPIPPFGSAFVQQDQPVITHGQGDLIRIWDQANNAFDTLAWFSAVPGDSWNVPQFEFAGACYFEVLDTGTRVVEGIPLRYLVVEEPIVLGFVDTLFERIGFQRFYLRPMETILIDFTTYGLVCYRDNAIDQFDGWLPGHVCDFTLTVNEQEDDRDALPYPNPGYQNFTVQLPPGPTTISLCDALGRDLRVQRTTGGNVEVDASDLPPGTYLVRTITATGSATHAKWIKQ
jgi:hypothetical protein